MNTIVIAESSKGELSSSVFELITIGSKIGSDTKVVFSNTAEIQKDVVLAELAKYGVSELHGVECGSGLSAAALAKYIQETFIESDPSKEYVVLGPQTYLGRDVVAHLSAYTNRPLLANAIDVELQGDEIRAQHAVFGGTKIVTANLKAHSPYLVIVRPKSIVPVEAEPVNTVFVDADASDLLEESAKTSIINSEEVSSQGPELEEASVVFAGGRGLGSKEKYSELVEETAKLVGAATGASRAIVDAGWVPYSKQVGQTGKTVKPDVYIACGISGATQHLVGMKGSKNIIAINTDDQAPIFDVADLGVVADVNEVIPKLVEKIKAEQ